MDEEDDWDWCASCDYVSSCFETCPTCQTKQCSGCAAACCYPEAIAQTLQPTRRKRKPTGNLGRTGDNNHRSTDPITFKEEMFSFRKEILALPPDSFGARSFSGLEELETALSYISDMYKLKHYSGASYVCSLNEVKRSNYTSRAKKCRLADLQAALRQKHSKLLNPDDPSTCSAKLRVDTRALQIRIERAHSCQKHFNKAPEALNRFIVTSLAALLQSGNAPIPSRHVVQSQVTSSRFSLLIPLGMKHLSQHIRNLSNGLLSQGLHGQSLDQAKLYLGSVKEIAHSEILTVTNTSNMITIGRRVLVFTFHEAERILDKIFSAQLALIFSLDLTHCVTDDSRRLLTLMIRSPDSLRFIPLMQAYTEGEDTDSITIALRWLNGVLNISSQSLPTMFLIDDSGAERAAIRTVFETVHIYLCLFHVFQNILNNLDYNSASLTRINETRLSFSEEELARFKLISQTAVKSALTISVDRHREYITQVTNSLADCSRWWSKSEMNEVIRWWNGYVARASPVGSLLPNST